MTSQSFDKSIPTFQDFAGKVALVTGSSRGIGARTAVYLAANGARVVINGRTQESVTQLVNEIRASGGDAIGFVADCTDANGIEAMRINIEKTMGSVSLLFPFAGGDGKPEPIEQMNEERWAATIHKNLISKVSTIKSFLPSMKAHGSGSIVLMCSSAGRTTSSASLAYSCAQAAVPILTKNLAQELGKSGIRVNAVAPATIRNEKIEKFMSIDEQQRVASTFIIPRLGDPSDVAAAALFLASDAASWITGVVLDVAGGKT